MFRVRLRHIFKVRFATQSGFQVKGWIPAENWEMFEYRVAMYTDLIWTSLWRVECPQKMGTYARRPRWAGWFLTLTYIIHILNVKSNAPVCPITTWRDSLLNQHMSDIRGRPVPRPHLNITLNSWMPAENGNLLQNRLCLKTRLCTFHSNCETTCKQNVSLFSFTAFGSFRVHGIKSGFSVIIDLKILTGLKIMTGYMVNIKIL